MKTNPDEAWLPEITAFKTESKFRSAVKREIRRKNLKKAVRTDKIFVKELQVDPERTSPLLWAI